MLLDFCVDERQIQHWKRIVETADNLSEINFGERIVEAMRPTTLYEIARLPKGKQVEVTKEAIDKQLTAQQTRSLVNQILSNNNPIKIPKGNREKWGDDKLVDSGLELMFRSAWNSNGI